MQVSDLKYWDSPVVDAYKINQLPVLYLLDKEGKIVNKDFAPDELKDILNEIFVGTGRDLSVHFFNQ